MDSININAVVRIDYIIVACVDPQTSSHGPGRDVSARVSKPTGRYVADISPGVVCCLWHASPRQQRCVNIRAGRLAAVFEDLIEFAPKLSSTSLLPKLRRSHWLHCMYNSGAQRVLKQGPVTRELELYTLKPFDYNKHETAKGHFGRVVKASAC